MVPRQAQSPVPYKMKSKYPVALLPGQYCDTVRQYVAADGTIPLHVIPILCHRFTSEELFSLPLSTALTIPGVPKRKPPPTPVQPLVPIQPQAAPTQEPPQHSVTVQPTTIPLARPLIQSTTGPAVRFPSSTPTAAASVLPSVSTSLQSSPLLSTQLLLTD